MKNTYKILAVAAITLVMVGCATPVTLTPGIPASTNALTGAVTPAVPPVTTYEPNHTVAQIAAYGDQAAPLVPAPYNTILLGALALATAVTGLIAKSKNAQANAAAADATNAHAAAATLASAIVGNPTAVAQATQIAANNGTAGMVAVKLANANSPT